MRVRAAFLALCIFTLTAWCADPTPAKNTAELHTLKGDVLKGELANITDKEIVLKVGGKAVTTPLPEILKLDFPAIAPVKLEGKYSDVELTDGSRLHCKEWTLKAKQVELKTMAGQTIKLPLSAVANILNNAQEEKYRKDWMERVSRKRRRDVAVRILDDTINPVEGTFGDADAEGKTNRVSDRHRQKRLASFRQPARPHFPARTRSPSAAGAVQVVRHVIKTSSWSGPSPARRPDCP